MTSWDSDLPKGHHWGYFPCVNGSSPGPAAFVAKERDASTTDWVARTSCLTCFDKWKDDLMQTSLIWNMKSEDLSVVSIARCQIETHIKLFNIHKKSQSIKTQQNALKPACLCYSLLPGTTVTLRSSWLTEIFLVRAIENDKSIFIFYVHSTTHVMFDPAFKK